MFTTDWEMAIYPSICNPQENPKIYRNPRVYHPLSVCCEDRISQRIEDIAMNKESRRYTTTNLYVKYCTTQNCRSCINFIWTAHKHASSFLPCPFPNLHSHQSPPPFPQLHPCTLAHPLPHSPSLNDPWHCLSRDIIPRTPRWDLADTF